MILVLIVDEKDADAIVRAVPDEILMFGGRFETTDDALAYLTIRAANDRTKPKPTLRDGGRRIVTPSNPTIENFGVENQAGFYVVSGVVTTCHDPDACIVTLTSSVPEFDARTLQCAEGGHFSFGATPQGKTVSGAVQAVATDTCHGLDSDPVDDWIG